MVTNMNGTMINFVAAVVLMDADICEQLNAELAPCTDQEFFAAYEASGERFALYKGISQLYGGWLLTKNFKNFAKNCLTYSAQYASIKPSKGRDARERVD